MCALEIVTRPAVCFSLPGVVSPLVVALVLDPVLRDEYLYVGIHHVND